MCGGLTESRVTIATKSHVDILHLITIVFFYNFFMLLYQVTDSTNSVNHQSCLTEREQYLIQGVYYFNKQHKASLGRNSWLFPRQKPLLPTCPSLVQKNKALMNSMHLLQLFSRRFKHRAAWNYRAGFSQQDDTLYVRPTMSEWIRSSASCTSRSCCVSSLVVSRRC